LLQKSVIQY